MRTLELLAPARNVETGKAAIDHGADAVYIGAHRYGARAAAGNSIDDIATLCTYAHQFGAKVYVTVNTIIYDSEMDDTVAMVRQLKDIGVDAILLQDMGLLAVLRQQHIDIPIHASTQTDNRTAEKVRWLAQMGIKRVVLARELTIEEIKAIHEAVPHVELEVFVHGALCVSYSGQCYASAHCFQRSANRGQCSQLCRMAYTLTDSDGNVIEKGRHLLSLKDLSQLENIPQLADAGAISFKIEGRLKDVDYVKNVTAAYSQALERLCRQRPQDYRRASKGTCSYSFQPDISKSFNRGFTTFFAHGRQTRLISPDTPKAIGERVGHVKEIRGNAFTVASTAAFANGDGLCFFNEAHELVGFRVNKAEGNRLFPLTMPQGLRSGTPIYRNHDQAFTTLLAKTSAQRRIYVDMTLTITHHRLTLTITDNGVTLSTASVDYDYQQANRPQEENMRRQLTRLGNSVFACRKLCIDSHVDQPFVANSTLTALRRMATENVDMVHTTPADAPLSTLSPPRTPQWTYDMAYLYNAANRHAKTFYNQFNIRAEAFETDACVNGGEKRIMQCRYCIRAEMGYCTKEGRRMPWNEPLTLRLDNGNTFRLAFNCNKCEMEIWA